MHPWCCLVCLLVCLWVCDSCSTWRPEYTCLSRHWFKSKYMLSCFWNEGILGLMGEMERQILSKHIQCLKVYQTTCPENKETNIFEIWQKLFEILKKYITKNTEFTFLYPNFIHTEPLKHFLSSEMKVNNSAS